MSCGTPVVATDCPSGPRELLAGGRHGRLVPVGDSTRMAAGILDALAGRVAPPPEASWRRYEQASVVDACLALLAEVGTR
jgi:glycosyltransferase involved in cell wall biosynthesis